MTVAAEAAREKGTGGAGSFRSLIRRNSLRLLRCTIARPRNLFTASWTRAEKGDAHDTRAIVQRLVNSSLSGKTAGFPQLHAAWKVAGRWRKRRKPH